MDRIVLGCLLALFYASPCWAWMNFQHFAVGVEDTADPYANMTFFWTCEANPLGAGDYSAGDATATVLGTISLDPAGAKYGTNGIVPVDGNDYYVFDAAGVLDLDQSRIGFWIYPVTAATETKFGMLVTSGGNLDMRVLSTGYVRIYGTLAAGVALTATTVVPFATWSYVEIAFDIANTRAMFYINGAAAGTSVDADFTGVTLSTWRLGTVDGVADETYMDNIIIFNDLTTEIYNSGLANLTESPK